MIQNFNDFAVIWGACLDIILLICCIKYCYQKGRSRIIRIFPIFVYVSIFTDLLIILGPFFTHGKTKLSEKTTNLIGELNHLFLIAFFNYLLFQLSQSKISKKIAWTLYTISAISFLLGSTLLKKGSLVMLGSIICAQVLPFLAIVILCFYYFKQLISISYPIELKKTYSYWLTLGILFYFSLLIPTYAFAVIFEIQYKSQYVNSIFGIYYLLTIVPYALFFRAITCKNEQAIGSP